MGKFFIDPYKMYYEKLNGASSMVQKSTSLLENSENVVSIFSRLHSQVSSSSWKELGSTELVNTSIPALKTRADMLSSNIESCLVVACDKAINTLLPDLILLKGKDELYEAKVNELNSLVEPSPKYVVIMGKQTDTYTSAYSNYIKKKTDLEKEISDLEKEINEIISRCDATANAIKGLDGAVKSFGSTTSGAISEVTGIELTENEKLVSNKLDEFIENLEDVDVTTSATGSAIAAVAKGKTVLYNDVGGYEYGYSRVIQTSHGKKVIVFQQAWCDNSSKYMYNDSPNDNKSLRSSGCGYNALASILSSEYPDITPEELFLDMGRKSLYSGDIKKYVEAKYGIPVGDREDYWYPNGDGKVDYSEVYKKEKLAEEISKGNMVLCTVGPGPDCKYTKQGHWVSLVDYDPASDQFYVTDSNDQDDSNAAPIDALTFLKNYEKNSNVFFIADDSGYKGNKA